MGWWEYKPIENKITKKESKYTGMVIKVVNGNTLMVRASRKGKETSSIQYPTIKT